LENIKNKTNSFNQLMTAGVFSDLPQLKTLKAEAEFENFRNKIKEITINNNQ
jgi:hypothetical protein